MYLLTLSASKTRRSLLITSKRLVGKGGGRLKPPTYLLCLDCRERIRSRFDIIVDQADACFFLNSNWISRILWISFSSRSMWSIQSFALACHLAALNFPEVWNGTAEDSCAKRITGKAAKFETFCRISFCGRNVALWNSEYSVLQKSAKKRARH